ncbi:hypothetical protein [Haladaptatus sp. DYF46]|uniref:hypothetical protein n=1 Tax=Haladaptatus sp. DYF46 TaxID=2886041 RepID=UPI001E479416|nr:hypothetical protein [Haladaptatus sp. DYF46]
MVIVANPPPMSFLSFRVESTSNILVVPNHACRQYRASDRCTTRTPFVTVPDVAPSLPVHLPYCPGWFPFDTGFRASNPLVADSLG